MNTKKLIVNADDFGQSAGVNAGIIECFENGILTSTSLMTRYPDAEKAAAYAKNHPKLGVGLHIDLGEWIFADGHWVALYEVAPLDDNEKIKTEIEKQLDDFIRIMNKKPSHLDSHQHIHLRENIKPIILDLAKNLDVTLRRCGHQVKYCGEFYGQAIDGSSLPENISVAGLLNILSRVTVGMTEIACHPGLYSDLKTMYNTERETEVRTLCNSTIKEYIDQNNILLCSFEGIPN